MSSKHNKNTACTIDYSYVAWNIYCFALELKNKLNIYLLEGLRLKQCVYSCTNTVPSMRSIVFDRKARIGGGLERGAQGVRAFSLFFRIFQSTHSYIA